MKQFRRVILAGFLVLTLLLCTACGMMKTYQDTNGPDDYSLQTLTEENLLRDSSDFSVGSTELHINGRYELSVSTFHGVKTLGSFSGSCSITLTSEITKGNARLVLCTKDTVLHEFALNEADQHVSIDATQHRVYLKLAGEDCGIKIQYTEEN